MTVNITEIRVRYCECDPMGVVHHTVYPVWFEMGRTEAGVLLAVVRLEARYRQPARYDEVLQLETSLATVGRVKVEHTYRLLRGEELLVTGATTLACLDKTGQARLLPDLLLAPQSDPG